MLGDLEASFSKEEKLKEAREEEDAFASLIPGFSFDQQEELDEIVDLVLWEDNIVLWKLYKTVRRYFIAVFAGMGSLVTYRMDTAVIIELAKAQELNVGEVLELLPELHSGYLSKILNQVGKEETDG